jgi:hypothetical protein
MTHKQYQNYFKDKDGNYVNDVAPCCFCTEEEYNVCSYSGKECQKYIDYVEFYNVERRVGGARNARTRNSK